jgi:glycosyltransferase involved in cell wall biosynthesis
LIERRMVSEAGAIALCHEWTTVYGGSEQVASRLVGVLGVRDVFTFAAEAHLARQLFPGQKVYAHRIGLTGFGRRHWPWLLPVMPRAWSRLDLSEYDVVVTSAHACVNAIRVPPGTVHISYCHTPMRYAWDWRLEIGRIPAPFRPAWPAVAHALRRADRAWSRRVTAYVANSHHVAGRIWDNYGREATVVHPPIDIDFWSLDPAARRESFFLFVGRLVPYKRPDVAIRAARLAGAELVVAGAGPELGRLCRMADDRVTFVENPSRERIRDLYRRCRALLNPAVEDFGMTMAEAQACGTPVIAVAEGGAREIVVNGRTGVLYEDPSPEGLSAVLEGFDGRAIEGDEPRSNAERFAPDRFDEGIRLAVEAALRGPDNGPPVQRAKRGTGEASRRASRSRRVAVAGGGSA